MRGLNDLLDRYLTAKPGDLDAIEAAIWEALGAEKTVLVLDMSGFSRITQEHGIVRFLALARLMQQATRPVVERYGGAVIKYEADNLFAAFDRPADAVAAAKAMNVAFDSTNILTDPIRDISVSIGIAAGKVLYAPGRDLFGDAMNVAAKLGEDLAGPGEILIAEPTYAALADPPEATRKTFEISDVEIAAFSLKF